MCPYRSDTAELPADEALSVLPRLRIGSVVMDERCIQLCRCTQLLTALRCGLPLQLAAQIIPRIWRQSEGEAVSS